MTYTPKTKAEKWFRWSVSASSKGNKRQKVKKASWWDDGWWEEGHYRKIASLKKEHEKEIQQALEYE